MFTRKGLQSRSESHFSSLVNWSDRMRKSSGGNERDQANRNSAKRQFVWKTTQDRTMQLINQEFGFQMSTSPAPGFGKDNRGGGGRVRGYRQDTVPVEAALGNRSKTSVRPWCFHVTALWPGVLQLSFLSHPRSFHGDTSSQSCERGESRRGPKRSAEGPSNQLQRQIII